MIRCPGLYMGSDPRPAGMIAAWLPVGRDPSKALRALTRTAESPSLAAGFWEEPA
jgi:hypothetical protein